MPATAKRNAKVEITSSAAGMDRGINDAKKKLRAFQREQDKAAKANERAAARQRKALAAGVNSRGGALIGGVVGGLAASAGFGLAGGLAGVAGDVISFEKQLTMLQVATRKSASEMVEVRRQIDGVSESTGLGREEVLGFSKAFVDLAGASALTPEVLAVGAKVMRATGTDANDTATMLYSLSDAFHIDPSQLESTLSGLNNLSKDGAIHFNQMAGEIVALGPKFAQFGVTGREGAVELAAMFQVTRSGFKSAEEASTGLQGIFRGLKQHADRFEKAGVQVFNVGKDGTKTFKPLSEIFAQIDKSKLAKDPTLLLKAFGRGEAENAYRLLATHRELLATLEKEGENTTSLTEDMATVNESPAGRIEKAWNSVKLAIAEALTPDRIEAFANAMKSAAGFIVDGVNALDHLLGGPSKQAGTDHAAGELVDAQQESGDQAAIAFAKEALAMSDDDFKLYPKTAGLAYRSGGVDAAKAGMRKYLDSQGYTQDEFGFWRAGTADRQLDEATYSQQQQGVTPDSAGDLAAAVRALGEQIANRPVVVKIDGNTVATAVANAPVNRRSAQGGR